MKIKTIVNVISSGVAVLVVAPLAIVLVYHYYAFCTLLIVKFTPLKKDSLQMAGLGSVLLSVFGFLGIGAAFFDGDKEKIANKG